jgi:hypothetical protein
MTGGRVDNNSSSIGWSLSFALTSSLEREMSRANGPPIRVNADYLVLWSAVLIGHLEANGIN